MVFYFISLSYTVKDLHQSSHKIFDSLKKGFLMFVFVQTNCKENDKVLGLNKGGGYG